MNGVNNFTPPYVKYSTGETVVGEWIDGKPVYQRVFTGTLPALQADGNLRYTGASLMTSFSGTLLGYEGHVMLKRNGQLLDLGLPHNLVGGDNTVISSGNLYFNSPTAWLEVKTSHTASTYGNYAIVVRYIKN